MTKKTFDRLDPDKRAHILSVGMDLYNEFPYEEVTIRLLCERLGINMATYYRYFPEKEDLALTIYEEITRRYLSSDVNVFRARVDDTELSDKERMFLDRVRNWPDEIYRKVIFESEIKYTLPMVRKSLQKERLNGNLRINVLEEFVAYLYCTMEYNLWQYCKSNDITDEETIGSLSQYMDESLFIEGIMMPEKVSK